MSEASKQVKSARFLAWGKHTRKYIRGTCRRVKSKPAFLGGFSVCLYEYLSCKILMAVQEGFAVHGGFALGLYLGEDEAVFDRADSGEAFGGKVGGAWGDGGGGGVDGDREEFEALWW